MAFLDDLLKNVAKVVNSPGSAAYRAGQGFRNAPAINQQTGMIDKNRYSQDFATREGQVLNGTLQNTLGLANSNIVSKAALAIPQGTATGAISLYKQLQGKQGNNYSQISNPLLQQALGTKEIGDFQGEGQHFVNDAPAWLKPAINNDVAKNVLGAAGTVLNLSPANSKEAELVTGAVGAAGKVGVKGAKKVAQTVDDATLRAHDNVIDKVAQTNGQQVGLAQHMFDPSLAKVAGADDIKAASKYATQLRQGKDIGPITTTTNELGAAEPVTKQGLQKYLAYKSVYDKEAANTPLTNDFGGSNFTNIPYKSIPTNHIDGNVLKRALDDRTAQLQGGYAQIPSKTNKTSDTTDYLKDLYNDQKAARGSSNSKLQSFKNDFNTKLIDKFSPIESVVNKAVKDGADIPLSNNITNKIDRGLRADTIAGQYIKDNGLAKIIQNVEKTKEFDQYVIAKHAIDLNTNRTHDINLGDDTLFPGLKVGENVEKRETMTGRNLEQDKKLVEKLAPQYEQHAQALYKYSHGILDEATKYGLVSKELAKSLKEQYPNYVPFNRIFKEDELISHKGAGGGLASRSTQTIVQKLKGSNRQIESPLHSFATKTADVIRQGETNEAAKTLASYKDLPGNPFQLRELGKDETVGTKSVISYLDNGEKRTFETTPEVAAAAKNLNQQQMNIVLKMAAIPTRALRLGATGVNVGFTLANVAKDMASAFINSAHPLESSALNLKVLGKSIAAASYHGGKSYGELVREGAGGTSFDIARDSAKQTVKGIRAQSDPLSNTLYTVTHPGQLLRAVENTIGRGEELTRAMQYYGNKSAGLKNGLSESDARIYGAMAARVNTVNFARFGEYGQVLNAVVPYLNAGVQGARTIGRNLRDRPKSTLAKYALVGALPVATTTAWALQDPKRKEAWDDISDTEKQNNLIIVPPNPQKDPTTGRWNVIKIPVSQEVANLNNIVRTSIEGKFNAAQAAGDVAATLTSFNFGEPDQLVGQAIPQALKPAIETITNKNLFTGNTIVPDSQVNLPANEQYGDRTSGTARTLGNLTNVSPRVIDNAIQTGLGGAGQTVVNASDQLLSKFGVISPDQVQGKDLPSTIATRFIGANSVPTSNKIQQQFDSAKQQLMNSDVYKNADQQHKANLLNSLQRDLSAVNYNAADNQNPNSKYQAQKPTKNQTALANGDLSQYIQNKTMTAANGGKAGTTINGSISNPAKSILNSYNKMSAADRTKAADTQNDYEYKLAAAQYENDKANGKLSATQDYKAQTALAKGKVGADYSKSIRDLYTLSKSQLSAYLAQSKNGEQEAQQILAYGDALQNAGIGTNKFRSQKTGAVSFSPSAKKAAGTKSASSQLASYRKQASISSRSSEISSTAKLASIAKSAKLGSSKATFVSKVKKTGLKQYSRGNTQKVKTA